jgi:hypothetical protein
LQGRSYSVRYCSCCANPCNNPKAHLAAFDLFDSDNSGEPKSDDVPGCTTSVFIAKQNRLQGHTSLSPPNCQTFGNAERGGPHKGRNRASLHLLLAVFLLLFAACRQYHHSRCGALGAVQCVHLAWRPQGSSSSMAFKFSMCARLKLNQLRACDLRLGFFHCCRAWDGDAFAWAEPDRRGADGHD